MAQLPLTRSQLANLKNILQDTSQAEFSRFSGVSRPTIARASVGAPLQIPVLARLQRGLTAWRVEARPGPESTRETPRSAEEDVRSRLLSKLDEAEAALTLASDKFQDVRASLVGIRTLVHEGLNEERLRAVKSEMTAIIKRELGL